MADMIRRAMNSLPPGGADEGVVVQRRHDRRVGSVRQPRQIKRQVHHTVNVDDVGLHHLEHLLDSFTQER